MNFYAPQRKQLRGREAEVLRALYHSVAVRGRMPTTKELCHDIGIARGSLFRITERLVAKGHLSALPRGMMTYRLLDTPLPVTAKLA